MTFQQAVQATSSIRNHYHPGLQALKGNHAGRITCKRGQCWTGSIDLDQALRPTLPNQPRWDYGIGFKSQYGEVAIWVEVHPASSTHINEVLKKLVWLRDWLRQHAPSLYALTRSDGYYWIATDGAVHITSHSPQRKRLAVEGLQGPLKVLQL